MSWLVHFRPTGTPSTGRRRWLEVYKWLRVRTIRALRWVTLDLLWYRCSFTKRSRSVIVCLVCVTQTRHAIRAGVTTRLQIKDRANRLFRMWSVCAALILIVIRIMLISREKVRCIRTMVHYACFWPTIPIVMVLSDRCLVGELYLWMNANIWSLYK